MSGSGMNNPFTKLLHAAIALLMTAVCVHLTLTLICEIWIPLVVIAGLVGASYLGVLWWRSRHHW